MTQEQMKREMNYRIAMAIARNMLESGVITEEDHAAIDRMMIQKFRPILSGLYP